eukprot:14294871-Alexandrium_andersonii.AAC.1
MWWRLAGAPRAWPSGRWHPGMPGGWSTPGATVQRPSGRASCGSSVKGPWWVSRRLTGPRRTPGCGPA